MSHAMKVFESDITAITNLQPDHLDWHRNIDEYYTAKRNLLEQTS